MLRSSSKSNEPRPSDVPKTGKNDIKLGAALGVAFGLLDIILGPEPSELMLVYALTLGLACAVILTESESGLICGMVAAPVEVMILLAFLSYTYSFGLAAYIFGSLSPFYLAYPLAGFLGKYVYSRMQRQKT